ncbi:MULTISPECIES: hypothetical protein [Olivibacter]|uniref:Uncharacterized protein n=1 Tax=Olivibacter jilunii TaxID=985016 RepID=A0ABW6B4F0_9SPHI
MNIELKNIKYYESFSEETLAFQANLYIEGKRAGTAKNDGRGGATYYSGDNKEGWELIRQAEDYTKTLPDKNYPKDEYMEGFSIPMNLEHYIDDLLNDYLAKKDLEKIQKKVIKDMEKGIVFGKPNDNSWIVQTFSVPLKDVLSHPKGAEIVSNSIAKNIFKELKDGVKILNTNIPESILKRAGLFHEQYVKPLVQDIGQQGMKPSSDSEEQNNSRGRAR